MVSWFSPGQNRESGGTESESTDYSVDRDGSPDPAGVMQVAPVADPRLTLVTRMGAELTVQWAFDESHLAGLPLHVLVAALDEARGEAEQFMESVAMTGVPPKRLGQRRLTGYSISADSGTCVYR